nr:MAG TPA_asm: hypothetical protein [Caudoviricetes sp.]
MIGGQCDGTGRKLGRGRGRRRPELGQRRGRATAAAGTVVGRCRAGGAQEFRQTRSRNPQVFRPHGWRVRGPNEADGRRYRGQG